MKHLHFTRLLWLTCFLLAFQPISPFAAQEWHDAVIPAGDSRIHLIAQAPPASTELGNEVFRGSTYITGPGSTQKAGNQPEHFIEIPPLSYPNWQGTKEQIKEILDRAEIFMKQKDEAAANRLLDEARDIAGKVIDEFLQIPIPPNPCDETYTSLLFDLAQTEMMGLTHDMPANAKAFQDRIRTVYTLCTQRFELEIEYSRRTDSEGYKVDVRVSGRIPVTIAADGPDAEGRFHARGYGKLDVAGSGSSGDCSVVITGTGDVELAGRFGFEQESVGLVLAMRHNINERHSMHCPQGTGVTDTNEWLIADQVLTFIPDYPVRQTHKFLGVHTIEMTWTLRLIKRRE